MKKLALFTIALSLLVGIITGCVAKENGIETETETVTVANYNMSDEYIIAKFYEAYDFWGDWIYGQRYVTDRMSGSQNLGYGAVNEESPIQSKSELNKAMKEHFTESLAEEFLGFLNPEEIDGKLYIAYGDVGDNGEIIDNVIIKKVNDTKYELILDMTQFFEDRKYTERVYYVFEDGRWVFENDEADKYFNHWKKHENIEYLPVMKKYYLALSQEWEMEKVEENGISDIISHYYENSPLKNIGYCFMDVNGDNADELLIGEILLEDKGDWGKVVWDMCSVKNGEPYQVFTSLERNRYYVFENEGKYMIANERSGSAIDSTNSYYSFDGEKLNVIEAVIFDGWNSPDSPWFIADDNDFDVSNDMPVDEKTATEIIESYQAKYITPQFISFETLG